MRNKGQSVRNKDQSVRNKDQSVRNKDQSVRTEIAITTGIKAFLYFFRTLLFKNRKKFIGI